MDGNNEEGSSSEDRQPIPTAQEIGESSGQAEKALQVVTAVTMFKQLMENPRFMEFIQSSSIAHQVQGNITAVLLFLSPMPTFVDICKKKSTGSYSGVPYLCSLANCLIWVFYGLPIITHNLILVITINGFGVFMEALYLLIYVPFARGKVKVMHNTTPLTSTPSKRKGKKLYKKTILNADQHLFVDFKCFLSDCLTGENVDYHICYTGFLWHHNSAHIDSLTRWQKSVVCWNNCCGFEHRNVCGPTSSNGNYFYTQFNLQKTGRRLRVSIGY
ncbi:hypothetical protein L7F22_056016 [Adiantum nelumboides]|nr:hypothetical protein [Adiantum nelumboides]